MIPAVCGFPAILKMGRRSRLRDTVMQMNMWEGFLASIVAAAISSAVTAGITLYIFRKQVKQEGSALHIATYEGRWGPAPEARDSPRFSGPTLRNMMTKRPIRVLEPAASGAIFPVNDGTASPVRKRTLLLQRRMVPLLRESQSQGVEQNQKKRSL